MRALLLVAAADLAAIFPGASPESTMGTLTAAFPDLGAAAKPAAMERAADALETALAARFELPAGAATAMAYDWREQPQAVAQSVGAGGAGAPEQVLLVYFYVDRMVPLDAMPAVQAEVEAHLRALPEASAASCSLQAEHVEHADGRGCDLHGAYAGDAPLCALIADPATTVEDIKRRKYGHAQFECMYELLKREQYDKMIAYAWCLDAHCPTASKCVFPTWSEARCQSEVYNWAGFAFRSAKDAGEYKEKSEQYYFASLHLAPENWGAWGYLGMLYAQTENATYAELCDEALCRGAGPDHASLQQLREFAPFLQGRPCAQEQGFSPLELAPWLKTVDATDLPHLEDPEVMSYGPLSEVTGAAEQVSSFALAGGLAALVAA